MILGVTISRIEGMSNSSGTEKEICRKKSVVKTNSETGAATKARWPDWAIFHQLGYFWESIVIFWKHEVAQ